MRRLEEESPDVEPESVPLLPEALQVERDIAVVRQLISELPEGEEKKTVQLFYLEGELSAREIAVRVRELDARPSEIDQPGAGA